MLNCEIKWRVKILRHVIQCTRPLSEVFKRNLARVAAVMIAVRKRMIVKVVIVASSSVWLWQTVSLSNGKNDQQLFADLSYYQNMLNALNEEVDIKKSDAAFWGLVAESFINGFTFGLFDKDGFNGPGKRYERWCKDIDERRAKIQRGIDNANADIAFRREKASIRNVAGVIAVAAILLLVCGRYIQKVCRLCIPLSKRRNL